jgi:chemotaxis protein CheX
MGGLGLGNELRSASGLFEQLMEIGHPMDGTLDLLQASAEGEMADTQAGPIERIRLSALFDAPAAAALHAQIRPLAGTVNALEIQADAVERVSTAGIQLLLATEAALSAHGGRLVLVDPAPVLCAALDDLGLAAELERWRTK